MLTFIQMVGRVVLTIFPVAFLKKRVGAYTCLNLASLVDTSFFPDDHKILALPSSGTASDPCTNP